jgi:hypothetical protein
MKTAQTVRSHYVDIKDRSVKMAQAVFPKENFPSKSPRSSPKEQGTFGGSPYTSVFLYSKVISIPDHSDSLFDCIFELSLS